MKNKNNKKKLNIYPKSDKVMKILCDVTMHLEL